MEHISRGDRLKQPLLEQTETKKRSGMWWKDGDTSERKKSFAEIKRD